MAIVIDRRFRGPNDSGNGGYSAGRFALAHGGDVVEVTLRLPPPLETPLELDGERIVDGDARRRGGPRGGARHLGARPGRDRRRDRRRDTRSRLAVPAVLRLRARARRRRAAHPRRSGARPHGVRRAVDADRRHRRPGVRVGRARLPRRLRDRRARPRRRRPRPARSAHRPRSGGGRGVCRRRAAQRQRRAASTAPSPRSSPRQGSCSGSRAPSGSSRAADRTSPPATSQTRVAFLDELDRLAEVDRLPVLERRARPAAEARRPAVLERHPVGGVVDVPEPVDVGRAERPRRARLARRRREREARRRLPSRGGGPVRLEEARVVPQRPQVVVEVDPDALGLDAAAALAA